MLSPVLLLTQVAFALPTAECFVTLESLGVHHFNNSVVPLNWEQIYM